MGEFADMVRRRIVDDLEISQREASRRTGVNQQTISLILSGQTDNPENETARKLITGLGLSETKAAQALAKDRAQSFLREEAHSGRVDAVMVTLSQLSPDEAREILAALEKKARRKNGDK